MMPLAFMVHSVRIALIVAIAMFGAVARADTTKAVQEFREGRALVVAGKCDEAIEHFRASLALAVAVGPLMNLGDCQAKLGKTASAVRAFEEAAALARQSNDAERTAECERMIATLRPTVSTLTIRSNSGTAQVLVDGQVQPFDVAIPLDGGEHEIVTDTGAERRTTTLHLAPTGDAQVFEVEEPPSTPLLRQPVEPPPPPTSSLLRRGAVIAGGAGVLGLAIGTIVGVTVLDTRSELDQLCPGYPSCPSDTRTRVLDLQNGADTRATVSTIALTAGAVFAATAIVLFILDTRR